MSSMQLTYRFAIQITDVEDSISNTIKHNMINATFDLTRKSLVMNIRETADGETTKAISNLINTNTPFHIINVEYRDYNNNITTCTITYRAKLLSHNLALAYDKNGFLAHELTWRVQLQETSSYIATPKPPFDISNVSFITPQEYFADLDSDNLNINEQRCRSDSKD